MRYTVQTISSPDDRAVLDRIWELSQQADDRGFRPNDGWWSLSTWATQMFLLFAGTTPIGGGGIHRAPDGAQEARLALLPEHRTPESAEQLVHTALQSVETNGVPHLRLTLPVRATWARAAARASGLTVARATLVMLRPASLGPLPAASVAGLEIRPLITGEEGRLLHALNHAWAGTWNFRPLTRRALERDLDGQRAGFLLAVDANGHIAGTIHAQFDSQGRNPDGASFAWLSNLTTAPAWRGQGLGRALLRAGIAYLHERGAASVALGVDNGAVAPVTLYTSAGFREIDRLEFWERLSEPERVDSAEDFPYDATSRSIAAYPERIGADLPVAQHISATW